MLKQFAQPLLPLGTPVGYAGLACRVTGRAFGGKPRYDLETKVEGNRYIFQNVSPEAFEIGFGELVGRAGAAEHHPL